MYKCEHYPEYKQNFYRKNLGKLSWQRHSISKMIQHTDRLSKFWLTYKCKAALGKDQFHQNLNI